jgi:hypothetical protein
MLGMGLPPCCRPAAHSFATLDVQEVPDESPGLIAADPCPNTSRSV